MRNGIPSRALEEHTIAETAIFWLLCHFVMFYLVVDLELKRELINSYLTFTGIVLKCTREESLREV